MQGIFDFWTWLARGYAAFSVLLLLFLALVETFQIFNSQFQWVIFYGQYELLSYIGAVAVSGFFPVLLIDDSQISIDLLTKKYVFLSRISLGLGFLFGFVSLLVSVVCMFFITYSYISSNRLSYNLFIPLWLPSLVITFNFALSFVCFCVRYFFNFRKK